MCRDEARDKMKATTPLPKLSDALVVWLYRTWSEETWAATFMKLPDNGSLPIGFVEFVTDKGGQQWTDYEQDLLSRWRRYEEES